MGRTVRWGGTIVSVTNRAHSTEIEILARPLDGDGEPRPGAPGEGRFLAEAQGFLDPAEYPNDRSLTIAGPLLRVETRQVGEYPYVYPVVRADSRWLWPESPPPYLYPGYGPWPWGGPWYDPWRWPFYGPPYGIYARPWSY
jgi:outer membrane lipoprotein